MFSPIRQLIRVAVLSLVWSGVHEVQGQFHVYPTFDDLVNETPKTYSSFTFDRFKGNETIITIRDTIDRTKIDLECATIWGFEFRGGLYRVVRKGKYYAELENFPVRLYRRNEVCYWVNGWFLENEVARFPSLDVSPKLPFTGFISSTIDGDLAVALGNGGDKKYIERAERNADLFFEDHPEVIWLKECVRVREPKGFSHQFALHCVQQHHAAEDTD